MNKAACTDAEESSLIQIENRLEDMMVTTEDWLYYLQDLMDLKIPKITENLIYYGGNQLFFLFFLNSIQLLMSNSFEPSPTAATTTTTTIKVYYHYNRNYYYYYNHYSYRCRCIAFMKMYITTFLPTAFYYHYCNATSIVTNIICNIY